MKTTIEISNIHSPTEVKNAIDFLSKHLDVEHEGLGKQAPKTKKKAAIGKTDSTPDLTIDDLRNLVQEKAQAGKRKELKDILAEYDAPNVSGLGAEHYQEFSEKVKAL